MCEHLIPAVTNDIVEPAYSRRGCGAISLHLASDEDGASIVKSDEAAGLVRSGTTLDRSVSRLVRHKDCRANIPVDVRES